MADPAEGDEAPPPPGTNKVEITVGQHTILVESGEPLIDVVGYALDLHQRTAEPAKQLPFGFDTTGGQFERAEPYVEPGTGEGWEDDHARGMDRQPTQIAATRRLVLYDPPGHHRSRLRPMQVDRGRAQVPGARY
jgi:hypothetical protein